MLTIGHIRTAPMDKATAQQMWFEVKEDMNQIYNNNAKSLFFEKLYRKAYNLVLQKHGDLLYNGVTEMIRSHLKKEAERLVATPKEHLMAELLKGWQHHRTASLIFKDIFMYLDRVYVPVHNKAKVFELGLLSFRDVVLYNDGIRLCLRGLLLAKVREERAGNIIDRDTMRSVLSVFSELSSIDGTHVYRVDFEDHFLKETETYYRSEALKYLSENSCPEYLLQSEQRIQEEGERVIHYLSQSTGTKLSEILLNQLIAKHTVALLNMETSGINWMLRDNKMDDLKRLYRLFSKATDVLKNSQPLDALRNAVGDYTKRSGFEIVAKYEEVNDPITFIKEVLALEWKMEEILQKCFRGEKKSEKKIQDAFDEFLNKDTRGASSLSLYLDHLMKGDLKDVTIEDIESTVERAVSIFRHLQDKDIFENFYRIHFARRLLSGKSISQESERQVITQLQKECGHQYTTKLAMMFSDIKQSREIMEAFHGSGLAQGHPVDLDVTVLTTGHWPGSPVPQCQLPLDVTGGRDAYQTFYNQKYGGRKLTWQTHMGSAILKANLPLGTRDLNVSTYQMCILVLFNTHSSLTLDVIRKACEIPEIEMRRHLLSLCTPKIRLVLKTSKGKGIEDNDVFTLNTKFTHNKRRIKVPLISTKEVVPLEVRRVPETVEEDRRHLIEAAIVRVMKARRRLTLNDLVAEVTRQLSKRFSPQPVVIKKRIESLIEREFIERDDDDRTYFSYIA